VPHVSRTLRNVGFYEPIDLVFLPTTNDQRLARISQLLRPLRRFHDGLDESHPQLPLLQL